MGEMQDTAPTVPTAGRGRFSTLQDLRSPEAYRLHEVTVEVAVEVEVQIHTKTTMMEVTVEVAVEVEVQIHTKTTMMEVTVVGCRPSRSHLQARRRLRFLLLGWTAASAAATPGTLKERVLASGPGIRCP